MPPQAPQPPAGEDPEDAQEREERAGRVLALGWESNETAVMGALLDRTGEVAAHIRLPNFHKRVGTNTAAAVLEGAQAAAVCGRRWLFTLTDASSNTPQSTHGAARNLVCAGHTRDVDALKELLRVRQPAVIVLGTHSLDMRRLQQDLQRIVAEISRGRARPARCTHARVDGGGGACCSHRRLSWVDAVAGVRCGRSGRTGDRGPADHGRCLFGRRGGALVHGDGAVRLPAAAPLPARLAVGTSGYGAPS